MKQGNTRRFIHAWVGDKKFVKSALSYAVPGMLQGFLESFLELMSTFFLTSYTGVGDDALHRFNPATDDVNPFQGGVVVASLFYFILISVLFGIVAAAGIFTAQYYGAKDFSKVRQTIRLSILLTTSFAVVFAIISILLAPQIVSLFDASDPNKLTSQHQYLLSEGTAYLRLLALTFPLQAYVLSQEKALRDCAKPFLPLVVAAVGITANLIMSPFFIGLVPGVMFGDLAGTDIGIYGVEGAAISLILARIIQITFMIIIINIKAPLNKVGWNPFNFEKQLFTKILKLTWPLILNELFWSIAITLRQTALFGITAEGVNAIGLAGTINEFFLLLLTGQSVAIAAMLGHSLGASKKDKAWEDSKRWMGFSFIVMFVNAIILCIISFFIYDLIGSGITSDARAEAQWVNILMAISLPAMGISSACFYALRSGGSKVVVIIDAAFAVVFGAGLTWFLFKMGPVFSGSTNEPWWVGDKTKGRDTLIMVYGIVQSMQFIKLGISLYFWSRKKWLVNLTKKREKETHNPEHNHLHDHDKYHEHDHHHHSRGPSK